MHFTLDVTMMLAHHLVIPNNRDYSYLGHRPQVSVAMNAK